MVLNPLPARWQELLSMFRGVLSDVFHVYLEGAFVVKHGEVVGKHAWFVETAHGAVTGASEPWNLVAPPFLKRAAAYKGCLSEA